MFVVNIEAHVPCFFVACHYSIFYMVVNFGCEKVQFVFVRVNTAPGAASSRRNHRTVSSHAGTEVQL